MNWTSRFGALFFIILYVSTSRGASFSIDAPYAKLLLKYAEGRSAVADLTGPGKFSDIKILFLDQAEIERRAGHDGGGIRQNPDTKKYEILLNRDLSDLQKAHAIVHELQHIRDEIDFDNYLSSRSDLNSLGPEVIKGLRGSNRDVYLSQNKPKVNFVLHALFCQERRAYRDNISLHRQGLRFENEGLLASPGEYIADKYVSKLGVRMSTQEITSVEKSCLESKTFSDFMRSIAPAGNRSTLRPTETVE